LSHFVADILAQSRKGRLVHVHQSFFAFLHNRDIAENGGVFVTRVRSLASVVPKGSVVKTSMDTTKMNPAMTGGAAAGGMVGSMMRGPRDRLQGVNVTVIKGPHKGYIGIIKDTNGPFARVEISSKSKVITIEKDKLRRRKYVQSRFSVIMQELT
jgi:transcription elongation factor SPT5